MNGHCSSEVHKHSMQYDLNLHNTQLDHSDYSLLPMAQYTHSTRTHVHLYKVREYYYY